MKKDEKEIKKIVRDKYSKIAERGIFSCSSGACCSSAKSAQDIGKGIGYADEELTAVPEGANLGLGCGNPLAMAALKEGDVVLDLGSGAGFDTFLASGKVGKAGRVIGVDMTQAMIDRARANAEKGGFTNVEFRLGEIENLPVENDSIDVIISNCVINLSPDKGSVFKEAFRVLKSGGRLMVSDLVLAKALPEAVEESNEAYVGCLAGAVKKGEYLDLIRQAGFKDIGIVSEDSYTVDNIFEDIDSVQDAIISIKISATKT